MQRRPVGLDKYDGRYAGRTGGMRSSAMRDLMSLTARPEVISLAGGLAATDPFPGELFERITPEIDRAHSGHSPCSTAPPRASSSSQEDIAAVMAEEGARGGPGARSWSRPGGQQAIDLVTKTFIDPGDVVLAEGPSYAGALTTFSTYQTDVRHVPMDDHGLVRGRAGGGAAIVSRPRAGGQVPLRGAQLQQPGGDDAVA